MTIIVKGQIPNNFSSSLIKGIVNIWLSYMQAVHYANGSPIYDVKGSTLCSDKNNTISNERAKTQNKYERVEFRK
jgi:hypothetical protein